MNRRQKKQISAWVVFLTAILSLAACSPTNSRQEVIVFAASSLTGSFSEIEEVFELLNPEIDLLLNFASSTALLTQIQDGGQADVFASADLAHMQSLLDADLIAKEGAHIFAQNELLLVIALDTTSVNSLRNLVEPDLGIVLALPEVPAGAYALQALAGLDQDYGAGFAQSVLDNVVSREDNVRQVLLKVELGEADAGFVYRTDAQNSTEVRILSLPLSSRPEILYSIGLLENTQSNDEARSFIAFVNSDEGQTILQSWGFTPSAISSPFSGNQ